MRQSGRAPAQTVGLRAQSSSNGIDVAHNIPRASTTLPATYPTTSPSRLLSVKDASAYLGVSVRSLWRLVDDCRLRVIRLPGLRRVSFDRLDLDALIEASRD